MMRLQLKVALLLALVRGTGAAAYVKFKGIEGESGVRDDTGASDDRGEFWFLDLKPGLRAQNPSKKGCARGKESGEKGGTEDINIGVGELQECTLSKSMDTALSPLLVGSLRDGTPVADCDFCFTEGTGINPTTGLLELANCALFVSMKECTVTKYDLEFSAGGSGGEETLTENVSFSFGRVELTFKKTDGSGEETLVEWENRPPGCRL